MDDHLEAREEYDRALSRALQGKDRYTILRLDGTSEEIRAYEPSHAAAIFASHGARDEEITVDLLSSDGCRWIATIYGRTCIRLRPNYGRLARERWGRSRST